MSSLPVVSTAAVGCPMGVAAAKLPRLVFEHLGAIPKLAGVTFASRLEVRPAPEMVSSGVGAIDALSGGFPRGCLTEVCGPASSGRTSVLLAALAAATQRQEVCALVDVSDALNPLSAAAAGVNFERLLWVRCGQFYSPQRHRDTEKRKNNSDRQRTEGQVEQALRVTDLLLQSGGFGLVVIDLGDTSLKMARRIPLASWFRFQRAVEGTPTVLFVISQVACAQTCAALVLRVRASGTKLSAFSSQLSGKNRNVVDSIVEGHGFSHAEPASKKVGALAPQVPTHAQLFDGLCVVGELLRSRMQRKPARSVTAGFVTKVRAG
jgi:RecA DNA recombination protein